MPSHTFTRVLLSLACLTACGPSPAAKATCEAAATRYSTCIGELLGPEAKALADSKPGIAACARDAPTVRMYDHCLPSPTCDAFLDCLEQAASGPTP